MTLQVATDNETDACGQCHAWSTMARLAPRALFPGFHESAKEFAPGRATYHGLLLRARRGECLSFRLCHASPEFGDGLQVPILSRGEGVVCLPTAFFPLKPAI